MIYRPTESGKLCLECYDVAPNSLFHDHNVLISVFTRLGLVAPNMALNKYMSNNNPFRVD